MSSDNLFFLDPHKSFHIFRKIFIILIHVLHLALFHCPPQLFPSYIKMAI